MSNTKNITGVVAFHDLETGFWGITDTDGNDWRPVHMPDQLKIRGAKVNCKIRILEDEVSIIMWGQPVEIIAFQTPMPGKH
jgi:hypothetical protein